MKARNAAQFSCFNMFYNSLIEGILTTGLINKQMSPAPSKSTCKSSVPHKSLLNVADVKLLIANDNKPKPKQSSLLECDWAIVMLL